MKTLLESIEEMEEALEEVISMREKIEYLEKKYLDLKRAVAEYKMANGIESNIAFDRSSTVFPNDENIQDKDLVYVQGGSYKPSFYPEERRVHDLYVSKYLMTQDKWQEVMKTSPSDFKGLRRPIESVTWIEALKCCNKLSLKYGLKPVYKIEDSVLIGVEHLDGETVYPNMADFERTEGYRLPTELEWEWFARGGSIAIMRKTFDTLYAGSNDVDDVAWYDENSGKQTREVGLKRPNELGLYDISGNVWEWVYDTVVGSIGYLRDDKPYVYDPSNSSRRLRGGSWNNGAVNAEITARSGFRYANYHYGFRVVRTKR